MPGSARRPTITKLDVDTVSSHNSSPAKSSPVKEFKFDKEQFRMFLERQLIDTYHTYQYIFIALPDLYVNINILAFYGFKEYAIKLMNSLSKKSRFFKLRHKEKLKRAFVNWKPPQSVIILDFGKPQLPFNSETYPKRSTQNGEKITQFLFYARYGQHPSREHSSKFAKRLSGMQIKFSDGMQT